MTEKQSHRESEFQKELRRQTSGKSGQKISFLKSDHLDTFHWYERINWLNCLIVFGTPALACYGLWTSKQFMWQTCVFAVVYYFFSGFGITLGYHRYFSHKAFKAAGVLDVILMLAGSAALQGSVKWWCMLHRAHHRFTDTDDDPYNARRGFWYSHFGWLLLQQIEIKRVVPMEDLRANKVVTWQHNNYFWLGPFMTLILPTIICGLFWGDIRGGFYIAGVFRLLFVHHSTWCVNSVAHWFGHFTFDDTISPRDSIFTGLLTLGEGYHNFHHEFPNDYRNGFHYWDYDPTKWLISFLRFVGLVYECIEFPFNEILRGETDMQQKVLDEAKKGISYGTPLESLPAWTAEKLQAEMQKGRLLIVISKVVYDVQEFMRSGRHPGGKQVFLDRIGQDCTEDFNGGLYNHTNAARNLMCHMRVAKVGEEIKKEK